MSTKKIRQVGDVEIFHFSNMSKADGRGLVQQAVNVRRNAYAPHSGFKVGCALFSRGGLVFYACNVEYAHYIVTHAERAALASMVAGGYLNIKMLVLAGAPADVEFDLSDKGVELESVGIQGMVTPCGDCRHLISEHCDGDKSVPILSVNPNGFVFRTTIGALYPHIFTF